MDIKVLERACCGGKKLQSIVEETAKDGEGLIFTNLVDTDMLYGHRNNIEGYARALEYFKEKI